MAPRKRRNSTPLATVNEPRWLKTLDRFNNELTSRRIEPMADLREVMRLEGARWSAEGWNVEGDGTWGVFFVNKDGDRIQVMLTPSEHPMERFSTTDFPVQASNSTKRRG